MNSILIYIPKITNRAAYTFEELLKKTLGLNIEITSDKNYFINYNQAKISYCLKSISTELHFPATELLFESGINNDFYQHKTLEEAFKINDTSNFSIDIFAASFFLLSRYEEYGNEKFDYTKSILHRSKLLQQPVIDEWMMELKIIFQQHFNALQCKNAEYKIVPTFDIDRAFAFKARSFFTSLGGFIRDLIKCNFSELQSRWNVLMNKIPDPFDVFDSIENINKSVNLQSIYFFHCGNYAGADKNIILSHNDFKTLLQKVSSSNIIGIHPSLKSIQQNALLSVEINTLQSKVSSQKISSSRQHFIQLTFPKSYKNLIANNITEDYTMGYADKCGFRAGTSHSFKWFDLTVESVTDLVIHPFCIMEATYQYYENNNSQLFLNDAAMLSSNLKKVGGEFCFVWHNQSFSELYEYKGWRKIYNHFLTSII